MMETQKPVLKEIFADNGGHSHWVLIDPETGDKLWSESPEECKAMGHPVKSDDVVTLNGLQELKSLMEQTRTDVPRDSILGILNNIMGREQMKVSALLVKFMVWLEGLGADPAYYYKTSEEAVAAFLKESENVEVNWNKTAPSIRRVFKVPIQPRKKWWQFWKTTPTHRTIKELIEQYKEEIEFSDETGELIIKRG